MKIKEFIRFSPEGHWELIYRLNTFGVKSWI
jgi:hypothetical protein